VIALALRTLARYVVPLAMTSVLVTAPLLAIAVRSPWPRNLPTANAALGRAYVLAAAAWMVTFLLVAAAAPLARSVAAGAPLSQPRALLAAFANTARLAVPGLAAIAAVVIGGLALVVPGLLLMVLLSLTGASEERGMPAPLVDSVAAVRARWRPVAAVVAIMIVVDVALVFVAWKLTAVPFAKKLTPAQWATFGNVARVTALGVLATAPIFATLLAAATSRRT
jgi:hypothetical protein